MADIKGIKIVAPTGDRKMLNWNSVYGADFAGAFVDKWQKQRTPSKVSLIGEYRNTIYACVDKNVQGTTKVPLKLYAKTKQTNRKSFWKTSEAGYATTKRLANDPALNISERERIEQVTDPRHPIIKLLHNPNPFNDYSGFMEFTNLFQELTGAAYYYIVRNAMGSPVQLWLLLPQYLYPVINQISGMVDYYNYGIGSAKERYELDEVIPFLVPNPAQPWQSGYSPLMSVIESVTTLDKYIATEQSILDNEGVVRGILSVKGDSAGMGEDEAARLERRFNSKVRRAGAGGIILLEEDMAFTSVQVSPRDLARLEVYGVTKENICNAYGVPLALLGAAGSQYDVFNTVRQAHIEDAIIPRLHRNQSILNRYLVSLFDNSGNLFLAYDDPCVKNRDYELKKTTDLKNAGIISVNEARIKEGYEPVSEGNILQSQTNPQGIPVDGEQGDDDGDEVDQSKPLLGEITPAEESEPSAAISPVLDVLSHYHAGKITRDGAITLIARVLRVEPNEAATIVAEQDQGGKPPAALEEDNDPLPKPAAEESPPESPAKQYKANGHDRPPRPIPSGKALAEVLRRFFAKQRASVMSSIHKSFGDGAENKAKGLPEHFVSLDSWSEELADESKPLIEIIAHESYDKQASHLTRVGASPNAFDVKRPELEHTIKKLTLHFAESTNKTTSKKINSALKELRTELQEGLFNEGESINRLADRVGEVFENLETNHCELIAQQEASRSYHLAQRQADIDSGVVTGWTLLLSSNACPICEQVAKDNGTIGLDGVFYSDPDAPAVYQDLQCPPLHVNCQCSMLSNISENS